MCNPAVLALLTGHGRLWYRGAGSGGQGGRVPGVRGCRTLVGPRGMGPGGVLAAVLPPNGLFLPKRGCFTTKRAVFLPKRGLFLPPNGLFYLQKGLFYHQMGCITSKKGCFTTKWAVLPPNGPNTTPPPYPHPTAPDTTHPVPTRDHTARDTIRLKHRS